MKMTTTTRRTGWYDKQHPLRPAATYPTHTPRLPPLRLSPPRGRRGWRTRSTSACGKPQPRSSARAWAGSTHSASPTPRASVTSSSRTAGETRGGERSSSSASTSRCSPWLVGWSSSCPCSPSSSSRSRFPSMSWQPRWSRGSSPSFRSRSWRCCCSGSLSRRSALPSRPVLLPGRCPPSACGSTSCASTTPGQSGRRLSCQRCSTRTRSLRWCQQTTSRAHGASSSSLRWSRTALRRCSFSPWTGLLSPTP
mmetsp:Transcript_39050/g.79949  ORF Transcript_39050/g.79949 Transcript_39050/m.79949 type:complete len:252 (+) Transcript_39050:2160-2915(+)